jgi:hypothetical protein
LDVLLPQVLELVHRILSTSPLLVGLCARDGMEGILRGNMSVWEVTREGSPSKTPQFSRGPYFKVRSTKEASLVLSIRALRAEALKLLWGDPK